MARATIVGTGPVDDIAVSILKQFGEVVVAPNADEESLIPLLDGAVGLVVRGDGSASSRVIASAPNLRVIGRTGAGYNNVDIETATKRGIPVVYTPGANARAVAEGAFALMLALCKRLVYWDSQLKQGNWKSRFDSTPGDLEGSTLGIIGFGSTGRALAELTRPFNMSLLAYDPYVPPSVAQVLGVRLVELDELLQKSDFVSIHTALTEQTRGLINQERMEMIKPGSYLVNMARGGIVESLDTLYKALESGKLAGVGLDVFEPEPPDVNHPIFKLQNCLTAPHSLGMTPGAMARIFRSMSEDMAAVLSGQRPKSVVNPEVLR